MVNLKMSPRFLPNKPIEKNLHNRGEFEDVWTFLTKQALLGKLTGSRAVLINS